MAKSQPTVSHHLAVLADAGLITKEKRGRWVHCTVNPDRLNQPCASIDYHAVAAERTLYGRK